MAFKTTLNQNHCFFIVLTVFSKCVINTFVAKTLQAKMKGNQPMKTPNIDAAVELRSQTYTAHKINNSADQMFGAPRSKINRQHKILRDLRTPEEVVACYEIATTSHIRSAVSKYRELLDKLEQTWAREFPDAPMPHPVHDYEDWYNAFDGVSSNHDFWALQWALYTNAVDTIVKEAY